MPIQKDGLCPYQLLVLYLAVLGRVCLFPSCHNANTDSNEQCPPINDRFGRLPTLRIATVIYIAGILGQGLCNGNVSGLYASRLISGLGMGPLTIIPPIYITEVLIYTYASLAPLLTKLSHRFHPKQFVDSLQSCTPPASSWVSCWVSS